MPGFLLLVASIAILPHPAAQERAPLTAAALWVRAVEEHQPGVQDAPLTAIASWKADQLERALVGLRDYVLIERAGNQNTLHDLMKRGALLHTDIVMLMPYEATEFRGLPSWPPVSGARGLDGEHRGNDPVSGHWEFARVLLDRIRPHPSSDDFVRQWYVAVAAYVEREGLLALALPHLVRARAVLRDDADILFLSGTMHEALGSSRHQAVLHGLEQHTRQRFTVEPPESELRRAERYFRDALKRRPEMIEARLHLGRVLGGLGRHQEAAEQLRTVVASLGEDAELLIVYYAQLFLGEEEASLGRRDAARASFEAARKAYPDAQSPLLALSALAREAGDRDEAVRAVREIARLDSAERPDPWWIYYLAHGRTAGPRLDTLRALFRPREEALR